MDTTKNNKKKKQHDDDDDEATMKKSHRKTPRDYKTGQQDKFLNNTIFFLFTFLTRSLVSSSLEWEQQKIREKKM